MRISKLQDSSKAPLIQQPCPWVEPVHTSSPIRTLLRGFALRTCLICFHICGLPAMEISPWVFPVQTVKLRFPG